MATTMEQHNKRSCLPIFLPETGAEVKNEDANNTWIHGTRHWTWKNQILPVQVSDSRRPDVPLQRRAADIRPHNIRM